MIVVDGNRTRTALGKDTDWAAPAHLIEVDSRATTRPDIDVTSVAIRRRTIPDWVTVAARPATQIHGKKAGG